ncbi:Hsp20/alpha crystallin family protein [Aquicella lusitana]|uniref:Heat shock protein Hsp20 n=1 Tax=Aquicella lusitana TaxID=254246 RepID=A0A370G4D4_9COXI|nr:Hsp20/alpha crystallin family protein [Aquicella lusitana]RDI36913.1 heat shock protein Hsp20 [Aquicella lusitana]VVC72372.1 Spore protein SP21 [Aquicella lusitana]VVC73692.1 Spore protein SP21 [Aquicella lusitana]VVC74679.1 Spore protein SP21 [Aquicella lusitana]
MNQIVKRPLFSNLSELHQALDRMFEPSSFLDRENWLSNVVGSNWTPTIDIKDEANQYVIRADVPGVDPKNIEVSIDKGMLTIRGHRETETKEERENYVHVERSQGSFYRTISLSNAADSSKISAKSKHGVLEITIPKAKESLSQKIQIKEE